MSDENGTLQVIAEHLASAVAPLDEAFRDVETFRVFMLRLGFKVDGLPPAYTDVADDALAAVSAATALADGAELQEIVALLRAVGTVYESAASLSEAPPGVDPAEFLPDIARNLFEYLLAEYLQAELPAAFSALEAFGVIRFEDVEPTGTRPGFVRTRFEWERIPEVLSDPASIPEEVFGWGSPEFDFPMVAEILSEMAIGLGLPSSVDSVDEAFSTAIQALATGTPAGPIRRGFTVPFFDVVIGDTSHDVGLQITELPAEGSALPGILVAPLIPPSVSARIDLGGGWSFEVRAGTDATQQLALILRPGDIDVRYPFAPGQPLPSAGFGFSLDFEPDDPAVVFGEPEGIRLEIAGATLSLGVDVVAGDVEVKFGAAPEKLTLVLSAASLDGFLGGVLGGEEIRIEAPLGLSWSNRTGLDFLAGAGFELALYPHLDFGVLRFDRIDLGVRFAAGAGTTAQLDVRLSAAFSGELGPIAYSVDRLGVQLPIRFEEGNAGPFDIDFGILWPTGLGLVIDVAGVVTGGGFISLDPEKGRYVGILEIRILEIGLTAIGILDTKDASGRPLPDPGFSLLIIVAAEFPPIQLGYGFTLNGVGGLAAINRRLDTTAFLAGVREGAVDSILFPEDPVENATTIVSNLTTIFPVAIGRYVFGPMAILGWGTPTLVRVELGVLIEVPDPLVLALIGQASIEIPTPEVAIVSLKLDVVAVLDLGKGLLALDASLRDSYIALFSIYGDMAMRLSWGDEPNFALAIGGLNPHFTAPAGFPSLKRVTVALGLGDNPRVGLEGYFAITSNSLQFGAKAELYAAAAGFAVKGWLGFDALLIYEPLSFRFDFSAGMGLFRGSSRIAGITVDGHLTGPSPFRAWGKGCISILFLDICVPFDATFGERRETALPPSDPWPLLEAAIQELENWSAEYPAELSTMVTLRAAGPDPDQLLLHPVGSATLRQKVLPFNRPLERFGEHAIVGPDRFDLVEVRIADRPAEKWEITTEHFAPGNFEALSETEKLSRPSFERMDAGVSVGGRRISAPMGAMKVAKLEYETKIIDAPWSIRTLGHFLLDRSIQIMTVLRGSKSLSTLANSGAHKFASWIQREPGIVLEAEQYTVATTDTLTARPEIAAGVTQGAATVALKHSGVATTHQYQVIPTHELTEAA